MNENTFFISCDSTGISKSSRNTEFDNKVKTSTTLSIENWNKNQYIGIRDHNVSTKILTLDSNDLGSIKLPPDKENFTICLSGHHEFAKGIKNGFPLDKQSNRRFQNIDHLAKRLYDCIFSRANPQSNIDIVLMMCEASAYDQYPQKSTVYQLASSLQKYQRKSDKKEHCIFSVKGPFENMSQDKKGISLCNYTEKDGCEKSMQLLKIKNGKRFLFGVTSSNPFHDLKFEYDKEMLVRTSTPTRGNRTLRFNVNRFNDNRFNDTSLNLPLNLQKSKPHQTITFKV